MEKFGRSQPVKRIEDIRFLTGQGRYVDDIAPEGALFAYVLRSQMAHGDISTLDVSDAREAEGVALVLTAQDMLAAGVHLDMTGHGVKNQDGTDSPIPSRPMLAQGRVRFVGEPIALIVADTLAQARDAAELIELDIDEIPVHVSTDFGGENIHPEAPNNQAFDFAMGDKEACDAGLAAAAHVVSVPVVDNRVFSNPMEPRGCYAEWDGERLHFCVNGQGVWGPKEDLAKYLGLPEENIRVTNPDVGGGFGTKGMGYPDAYSVAVAAKILGRPVRWMADRTETMLSDNAGRDLVQNATLGFDENYKLVAYKIESTANMGAYAGFFALPIQSVLFSKVFTGTYDVQAAWMNTKGNYSNTTQVDAYRGAGRPEAIYVLERAMDMAARELGVDPFELHRRSFIRPDQFPYTTQGKVTYDVGEYTNVLNLAEVRSDRAGFAARKAASEAKGLLRGIGLSFYVESILGNPSETAAIEFLDDGRASIAVGTQSNGQGHETVFTQFLADQTGIPPEKIVFVQGDSDAIPTGGGTGGSRSVTVQNNATLAAVDDIVTVFSAFLAEQEGVDAAEISFDHETFNIAGSNLRPTMLEVADLARAAGRDDLLNHSTSATLPNTSFPNGCHVAEAEVDPETGHVQIDRYTVVDDFGNLINPMLVEGQIHGGVAQGLGQAITEHVVYDDEGQLLSATFMDYGMPRADTMPFVSFTNLPVPSKYNIMGMKGCGEAGTVGSMAAAANAVQDALWEKGVKNADMPFTPTRVWQMLQDAGSGAS